MNSGSSVDANTERLRTIGTGLKTKFAENPLAKSVENPLKRRVIQVPQVLLIDDNPTQLRVRETILRGAGFKVSIATTAESAFALLRISANHFGVIVTDHVLPGASGADFVRELRKADPITPVVVVSGMPDVEEEYDGLNTVVRHKPLPPQDLIDLVRERMPAA
jgi:DNA-binding response OmpR family regulator